MNYKQFILSGASLVFLGVLVAGGTYAAWTDTQEIEGNTLSTGNLSIALVGEEGREEIDADALKPLQGENMFPGHKTDKFFQGIENESSIAVDLYLEIEIYGDGYQDICRDMELTLWSQRDEAGVEEDPVELGTYTIYDLSQYGDTAPVKLTGVETDPDGAGFWNLPEGWVMNLIQQAKLVDDARNESQGKTCEFTEVIIATQTSQEVDEQPWSTRPQ